MKTLRRTDPVALGDWRAVRGWLARRRCAGEDGARGALERAAVQSPAADHAFLSDIGRLAPALARAPISNGRNGGVSIVASALECPPNLNVLSEDMGVRRQRTGMAAPFLRHARSRGGPNGLSTNGEMLNASRDGGGLAGLGGVGRPARGCQPGGGRPRKPHPGRTTSRDLGESVSPSAAAP